MPLFRHTPVLCAALALLLAFAPAASAWNADPSQPAEALFAPGEVRVTVEERLRPEELPVGGSGFLLALPHGADAESFVLSIDGAPAGGYSWIDQEERRALLAEKRGLPVAAGAALPKNESSPERRALVEAFVNAQLEVSRMRGEREALDSRKLLLRKTLAVFEDSTLNARARAPRSVADEAGKLEKLYARLYPQIAAEEQQSRLAMADAEKKQRLAEKALREFDNRQDNLLLAVYLEGPGEEERTLRYSYTLQASCQLSYRLDARPDDGEVAVTQDAVLTQFSGFAWEDAEISIATIRRDRTLQPGLISPWRIVLESPPPPTPAQHADALDTRSGLSQVTQMALPEASPARRRQAAPPEQEDRASFRLWKLGKRPVDDSVPVRLALSTEVHKADFLYTLRPAADPKGFLTAELSLPKPLELPPGMARFAVDGTLIGSRMFSFNGDKGSIYFGSDPQVTATMRDLKRSGGEEGFFSKDQTLRWHWLFTLKSTRPKPVKVILEDAAPVSGDSAVSITISSTPKAEEVVNPPERGGARIVRWKATLKPGETVEINHKVEASAPAGKEKTLRPGR